MKTDFNAELFSSFRTLFNRMALWYRSASISEVVTIECKFLSRCTSKYGSYQFPKRAPTKSTRSLRKEGLACGYSHKLASGSPNGTNICRLSTDSQMGVSCSLSRSRLLLDHDCEGLELSGGSFHDYQKEKSWQNSSCIMNIHNDWRLPGCERSIKAQLEEVDTGSWLW